MFDVGSLEYIWTLGARCILRIITKDMQDDPDQSIYHLWFRHRHSLSCCFKQLQTTTCILFRWELHGIALYFLNVLLAARPWPMRTCEASVPQDAGPRWSGLCGSMVHPGLLFMLKTQRWMAARDGQGWPGMGRMCQMGMVAPRHFVLSRGHLRVDRAVFGKWWTTGLLGTRSSMIFNQAPIRRPFGVPCAESFWMEATVLPPDYITSHSSWLETGSSVGISWPMTEQLPHLWHGSRNRMYIHSDPCVWGRCPFAEDLFPHLARYFAVFPHVPRAWTLRASNRIESMSWCDLDSFCSKKHEKTHDKHIYRCLQT